MRKLSNNFTRIFWIRALLSVKMINIVLSLFYLHRGVSLSEIMLLSLFFSITISLFEIPSSYLADRWGRKPTIIVGCLTGILHWVCFFLAHDVWIFALGTFFYAVSDALLSGTDEALVYDTTKQLEEEHKSLTHLGRYHSAKLFFKVVGPVLAVFLAAGLTEGEFQLLLWVDIIASTIAVFVAFTIVEPNHNMDLEKLEAGVMKDAWKIFRQNPMFLRAVMGKMMIFMTLHLCWDYFQHFFTGLGVSVVVLGILWSLKHLCNYIACQYVHRFFPKKSVAEKINILNGIVFVLLFVFICVYFFARNGYILYILFCLFYAVSAFRASFYSEFFNKMSHSYNRATLLSLTNFLRIFFDTPLIILAAYLVSVNVIYPYVLAVTVAGAIVFLGRLNMFKD